MRRGYVTSGEATLHILLLTYLTRSPLDACLDVLTRGNLLRNHAAQELLKLLEKSIHTRGIDPDRSEISRRGRK